MVSNEKKKKTIRHTPWSKDTQTPTTVDNNNNNDTNNNKAL